MVQGVGFRFTAREIARRHSVTGEVRNLRDGRVELLVEGDEKAVGGLLNDIADAMGGTIHDTEIVEEPPTGEWAGFRVAFAGE